jgi:hypothetical protein
MSFVANVVYFFLSTIARHSRKLLKLSIFQSKIPGILHKRFKFYFLKESAEIFFSYLALSINLKTLVRTEGMKMGPR